MDESKYTRALVDIARTYDVIDQALFAARLAAQSCDGEHRKIMMRVLELLEPLHDERHKLENALYDKFNGDAPSAP